MSLTLTLMDAIIGAVGVAMVGGIIAAVRALIAMRRGLETLMANDESQAEAIQMIAMIQRPQLAAHKATLEAMKGECNGNVEEAHKGILDAFKVYDKFLAGKVVI